MGIHVRLNDLLWELAMAKYNGELLEKNKLLELKHLLNKELEEVNIQLSIHDDITDDEMNICDLCKHSDKDCNVKPCSICMQWVDGYLEATRYEPKL